MPEPTDTRRNDHDTIVALSSGAPPAAIALLRITGAAAFATAMMLVGSLPLPRRAALRAVRHPEDKHLLDRALVLVFPGPNSATGDDLVELHCHGGRAVIAAVQAAVLECPGTRLAEPGEFTRRALLNGRIDLAEAEGLGDLLTAETESQRRAAIASAEGAVSRAAEGWRGRILSLAAVTEALLDFSDEDDVVSGAAEDDLRGSLAALHEEMRTALANPPVERLRDGVRIVLAGPPNVGKSTLLNALVERDAAIVSAISGTTRDLVEVPVSRNGTAYVLIDTAGLLDMTDDPIETVGIARAREALETADLILWLGEDTSSFPERSIAVASRADLLEEGQASDDRLLVSASTGEGLSMLWEVIGRRAAAMLPRLDQLTLNERQRKLVASVANYVRAAAGQRDLLLLAEHLRSARRDLELVTGRTGIEDMLDALFSRFCVGK